MITKRQQYLTAPCHWVHHPSQLIQPIGRTIRGTTAPHPWKRLPNLRFPTVGHPHLSLCHTNFASLLCHFTRLCALQDLQGCTPKLRGQPTQHRQYLLVHQYQRSVWYYPVLGRSSLSFTQNLGIVWGHMISHTEWEGPQDCCIPCETGIGSRCKNGCIQADCCEVNPHTWSQDDY